MSDTLDDDRFNAIMRLVSKAEADGQNITYDSGDKPKRDAAPLERKVKQFKKIPLIAYDLETTRIAEGTPDVLYITAYAGGSGPFHFSSSVEASNAETLCSQPIGIRCLYRLLEILETYFLIPQTNGVRFVAWNGNGYDAYFVSEALKLSDNWIIHPYLTKGGRLRGMKVEGINDKKKLKFEFLDGMAMTGLDTVHMPLKKFVGLFAPQYPKLEMDFENEEFDANNAEHVAYAERDAEALWYAMRACNEKVEAVAKNELQPTMGKLAITYLQSKIPEGVKVWKAPDHVHSALHRSAKRGGYVWIAKQFKGKIWKYDINQAYAAAMRDCAMPCGSIANSIGYTDGLPGVYRVRLSRRDKTPIPFYYKDADTGTAGFTDRRPVETYILSNEIEHLNREGGWNLEIIEGWIWNESFNLAEMVNELEVLRFSDPEGPSGPLGIVVKTLGNSAYGKTLELLGGLSLVMAKNCPEGYEPYLSDRLTGVFAKHEDIPERPYHKPQLGAFITAHVRIKVREAALSMHEHFVYADTDCVCFTAPAKDLIIDPRHYGDWKLESAGVDYTFIGKKVYFGADGSKHAKGLRLRELEQSDFERWYEGAPPTQKQLQRMNYVKVLTGSPMFKYQERKGTDIRKSKTVKFDGENFSPI